MNRFLQQHVHLVSGMISGWDRLRFRGTLTRICYPAGLSSFFRASGRLFKQFKEFALQSSRQLIEATDIPDRQPRSRNGPSCLNADAT